MPCRCRRPGALCDRRKPRTALAPQPPREALLFADFEGCVLSLRRHLDGGANPVAVSISSAKAVRSPRPCGLRRRRSALDRPAFKLYVDACPSGAARCWALLSAPVLL